MAGLVVTALLQSSTATAFMIASLSGLASIELAPALAVMLGANVGTTLIVQALSFDTQLVSPLLIITGVAGAGLARRAPVREAFIALLGLGLMLLSLHLMRETLKPMEQSQTLRLLLASLTRDAIMNMGLAALFAWIAHSSVAAVLFVMSLAGAQLLDPQADNLAMRLAGCVMVAPLLPALTHIFAQWDPSPTRLAADFHLAFNLSLALVFIGWLPALARLLGRLLPDAPAPRWPPPPSPSPTPPARRSACARTCGEMSGFRQPRPRRRLRENNDAVLQQRLLNADDWGRWWDAGQVEGGIFRPAR